MPKPTPPTTARSKDEIDARNRADSMVYQVEKMLKDHRDKISDDDAKAVEEALERHARRPCRRAASRTSTRPLDNLRRPATSWRRRCTKPPASRAQALPRRAARHGAGAGESKPKDNVVDAEFVDVDDKK